MLKAVKERLRMFGYTVKEGDDPALTFSISKTEETIKNGTNQSKVPNGLEYVAVDMAIGEFLRMKKAFAPGDLDMLDLDNIAKQLKLGDTTISYAVGEGSQTQEQRLDSFINYLCTNGLSQLTKYRRLCW